MRTSKDTRGTGGSRVEWASMKLFIFRSNSAKFAAALLIRASDKDSAIKAAKEYAFGQHGLPPDDFPTKVDVEEVSVDGDEAVLLASTNL